MPTAAERNPRTKAWSLKGREPEIIRLRDEEGMTFGEMGDALDVTPEGARVAYNRAKALESEAPTGEAGGEPPEPHPHETRP